MEDGRGPGGELKCVAIAACNDSGSASPLLRRGRSGEEIVGLISRRLGICETAGGDEARQQIELIEQLAVELPPGLVTIECLVPISRRVEGVPTHENSARLLLLVKPQKEIGEADDRAAAATVRAPDRFRQTVVGAVGEEVAVHDEQRLAGAAGP